VHTDGPAAPNPPGNVRDLRLRVVDPQLREAPLAPDRLAGLVADAGG
jgi:hypothetical protein